MTRKISVGLVVDVPDEFADTPEDIHIYLEDLFRESPRVHIRTVEDITYQVAAARAKGARR